MAASTTPKNVAFVIRDGRARYEGWQARNGRWYYHRNRAGRITDGASYASRRSCRRAILRRIAKK